MRSFRVRALDPWLVFGHLGLPSFQEPTQGKTSPEVWGHGEGQGGPWEPLNILPWLSLQGSGHNVSQEALAIKRMLEIGAVKNLTYF